MTFIRNLLLGTAGLAAIALPAAANATLIIPAGTPGTTGVTGLYVDEASALTTSDATATAAELATYLGRPDDVYTGLANAWIQFDLGGYRLVNGAGADFNVYEYNSGAVEFGSVDILVSLDGTSWYNVDADIAPLVDLAGDELHGSGSFRRAFDITNALAQLGVSELRYVRLDGTSGGTAIGGSTAFDPDAVGFINFAAPPAVPEPASWAMMIAGFGLAGATLRQRRARMTSLRFAR